ncbi:glycosyltransferase [Arabiibacter massiliensis]|uniref:glycosyltransferase n=1 Tax=Arabiibacter massiliensis TaxID=1870985 RepID=UPI0009B9A66C|nr:glycosyltransferase [Arabiibacter massiliensis]
MSGITYIGSFPPPYGGVTVKNSLLYKNLLRRFDVDKINLVDVKSHKFSVMIGLASALVSKSGTLVVGASAEWRRRITCFLYLFNRKKMARSLLFFMGGKVPEDKNYVSKLGCFKRVYVETEGMRKVLERTGAQNVSVYPNCRERADASCEVGDIATRRSDRKSETLSCVYFSQISAIKGAAEVIGAARMLPDVAFHFYGMVDDEFSDTFFSAVQDLSNVKYHGVFDSAKGDVIGELSLYDLHLFPTSWPHEGVPGVLVETKMAAVPSIVSDCCYNKELVLDGVDGVVLTKTTTENLAKAIRFLQIDRDFLDRMKAAAYESANNFYIDHYLDRIMQDLEGGVCRWA